MQSNLIKSRMNILITSVSACPPPLLSRCQVPQFSAVSRRKSGCSEAAPNNFPPCLVCAAHKLFAFARKLFLNLRGKRHVSNMIFSILAKKWSRAVVGQTVFVCLYACVLVVEAVLVALTTIYDTWRLPSSHAEDKMFLCYQQMFLCYKQI